MVSSYSQLVFSMSSHFALLPQRGRSLQRCFSPAWVLVCLFCLFIGLPTAILGQSSLTISGVVREAKSGETVIGASVVAPALSKGVYTSDYGFYSLSLPANGDSVEIRYVFAGFETVVRRVKLDEDQKIDVELSPASLDEVVIEAQSFEEQLNSTQMSVERVSIREAKKIPALFGEVDIIKTLQLKPGVSSGSEGSSGIFVRGGGSDQNLVLLDNTVLYNPSHLFGFFSTFNSDAVKDVELYKGGFPPRYGGRLSSVIDVKLKEGNRKKFSGTGGLGLIASRLTLEGPLGSDKVSYVVSGRRTYVDLITDGLNEINQDNENWATIPGYFFYDFNAKINYEISDKDQLYLSGYLGRDRFRFEDGEDFSARFAWGNTNLGLRWNHFFSSNFFVNTAVSYTDYEYELTSEFVDIFTLSLGSKISDWAGRTDFTWTPLPRHTFRFGAQGIYHTFVVGNLDAGSVDSTFDFDAGRNYYGTEMGLYLSDEFEWGPRLKINLGMRLSGFASDGIAYLNPEPRASAKFSLSDKASLKASYARMSQYLHLVAASGTSLPTDIWYPSNRNVKPQISDQVAMGITVVLGDKWLLSNEIYYKWLQNQIDFKDGANLFVNDDLETEFVFGKGSAYGNEFYIEKTAGKLTGWIGYTLAWSWRQFRGQPISGSEIENIAINDGDRFHPRNDRRHDISIVTIYEFNRRWSVSASWEYRTGNATTFPRGAGGFIGPDLLTGGVALEPSFLVIYGERNQDRLPAYHRMDLGVVIKFFPQWGESDLTISAYNAYNRRNVYFVRNEVADSSLNYRAEAVSLFPILPSVTYNFKF